jgi:Transcriptional Coactivator p15 (PC4)
MSARRTTLDEPIIISKFWKNRRRNESVRVSLSEYEGHCLINVRVYCTGTDGIDRPTPKGVAMTIRKLPELSRAMIRAEAKARELGLLDDEATAADFSDTTLEVGPSETFNQRLRS